MLLEKRYKNFVCERSRLPKSSVRTNNNRFIRDAFLKLNFLRALWCLFSVVAKQRPRYAQKGVLHVELVGQRCRRCGRISFKSALHTYVDYIAEKRDQPGRWKLRTRGIIDLHSLAPIARRGQ